MFYKNLQRKSKKRHILSSRMYVDLLVPFFQFFNIFPFDVSFCLFVINCLEVFFNTYMQEFEKIMGKFTSQEATENNKGLNHNIFILLLREHSTKILLSIPLISRSLLSNFLFSLMIYKIQ